MAEEAQEQPEFYITDSRLREYISEALERNPSIQEALARYRAALQKVPQVTALPDPVFGSSSIQARYRWRYL